MKLRDRFNQETNKMKKEILFNSSLPRAGSTLIQNLVGQNQDIYVTPTSGLSDLILNAKNTYNHSQAFQAQDSKQMEKSFIEFSRAGMQGYFNGLTDKPMVLDKSREWGINYGLLEMFQESPKVICMVRDVRAVFASMEKNFRKNPHKENHIQNPQQLIGTTLDKRIDIWASGIPVGISMDRLRDMIQQGIDKKVLFIRYEDLMSNPEEEMKRFYDYIGKPYYEGHDFENVTQITHENDVVHGIYGDHTLRQKFERKPDDFMDVLGYELSMNIRNHYKWFYDYFGYV
jgi:sulfotransferase